MTKKDNEIIDAIFSDAQATIMKKAVTDVSDVTPNLKVFTFRIGNEVSILLSGKDFNDHNHYTMLSQETFEKLKSFKIKGV